MYKPNGGINNKVHERVNQIKILTNSFPLKVLFKTINFNFVFEALNTKLNVYFLAVTLVSCNSCCNIRARKFSQFYVNFYDNIIHSAFN